MNILGKILVFLNLLFALAVGGFLLIDFQTRVNWKSKYDELKKEFTVARSNSELVKKENGDLHTKLADLKQKAAQTDVTTAKKLGDDAQLIPKYDSKMVTEQEMQKAILVAVEAKQKQLEKYELENKTLAGLLTKRDQQVLVLQQQKDKYYREMTQALNDKDIAVGRADQLMKQLKEVTLLSMKKDVLPADGGPTKIKSKNDPNPPPFYIKGTIVKVLPDDNTLVEISLGSDQGLKKDQTLEAFRKQPTPKYLGMIRLVEVTPHRSVGQLVQGPYAAPVTLKTGDEVASQILPGY